MSCRNWFCDGTTEEDQFVFLEGADPVTYITLRAGASRRIQRVKPPARDSPCSVEQECPTPKPFSVLEAALADVQPAEPRVETPDEELNTLIADRIPERAVALDPVDGSPT